MIVVIFLIFFIFLILNNYYISIRVPAFIMVTYLSFRSQCCIKLRFCNLLITFQYSHQLIAVCTSSHFEFMTSSHLIIAFLIGTILATIDLTACQVVEGKLSCLDCSQNYDFSGIMVGVLCAKTKKMAVTTAENDGSFLAEIPVEYSKSPSSKYRAKLLGGPTQLYASRNNMVSEVVKSNNSTAYTVSRPLIFSTSCPKSAKCEAAKDVSGSKTVDLPLPPEWGLAPSSYYAPFVPIIGVP